MRWDRYDATRARAGLTEDEMSAQQMFRIHESFRIVAVGEPPSAKEGVQWLTSETVACFSFHITTEVAGDRLEAVLQELYPQVRAMPSLACALSLLSLCEALMPVRTEMCDDV